MSYDDRLHDFNDIANYEELVIVDDEETPAEPGDTEKAVAP